MRAGRCGRDDLAGLTLDLGIDRAEHRTDRDGADLLLGDVPGDLAQFVAIERRDRAAVKFVAAMSEVEMAADRVAQIGRPIDHGRQSLRRRQAEPDRRGRRKIAPLHDGVGEMGRPKRHHVDRSSGDAGLLQRAGQGLADAGGHIGRGDRLDAGEDILALHDHGVGIRAADINADPDHLGPPLLFSLAAACESPWALPDIFICALRPFSRYGALGESVKPAWTGDQRGDVVVLGKRMGCERRGAGPTAA